MAEDDRDGERELENGQTETLRTSPGGVPEALVAAQVERREKTEVAGVTLPETGGARGEPPQEIGKESWPLVGSEEFKAYSEAWKMARDAIVHEDDLVDQRLRWLIQWQTAIIPASLAIQTLVFAVTLSWQYKVALEILLVLTLFGSNVLATATTRLMGLASLHQSHLLSWWRAKYQEDQRAPWSKDLVPKRSIQIVVASIVSIFRRKDDRPWWLRMAKFEYTRRGPSAKEKTGLDRDKEPKDGGPETFPPIMGSFDAGGLASNKQIAHFIGLVDLLFAFVYLLLAGFFCSAGLLAAGIFAHKATGIPGSGCTLED